MSLRKEILILVFVLAGCLIIIFSNPSQSVNKLQPVDESIQEEIPVPSQNLGIFQQTQELSHSIINRSLTKTDNVVEENNNLETIASRPEENTEILGLSQASLSLKDILAKAKNLSSDLNLEFEKYQSRNCSICQTGQQGEDDLEEYLSSKGYSSWEAYSSSADYRLAKEHFLSNKNNLLRNPSIYLTIYTQIGAGLGCGCWDPACYVVTPAGIYWHCLGPCCCACCIICCRF